jgi:protein-disulfide isomerase
MKRYLLLGLAAAMLTPLGAQEPGITKAQADRIIDELRQIREILANQARLAQEARQPAPEPPPTKAKFKVEGGNILGAPDAPVTMVEFTDYQCPYCQRFHVQTFAELKKQFIDTGKVRFVSRDFPLDFHPNAMKAAEAARCAGDQKQFWRMRDVLGSNPSKLSLADLGGYAKDMGLDMAAFKACLDSNKHKAAIEADTKFGASIGISGTPSFVIGKTTEEGVDGELVVGALPLGMFEEKIKAAAAK